MNEYGFGFNSCLDGTRKMLVQVLEGRLLDDAELSSLAFPKRQQKINDSASRNKQQPDHAGNWPEYRDSVLGGTLAAQPDMLRAEALRLVTKSCVFTRKAVLDSLLPKVNEKRAMLQEAFERVLDGDAESLVLARNILGGLFFRSLVGCWREFGLNGGAVFLGAYDGVALQTEMAHVARAFSNAVWEDGEFWKGCGVVM